MDIYGADPLKELLKSWNLFRKISPTFADLQIFKRKASYHVRNHSIIQEQISLWSTLTKLSQCSIHVFGILKSKKILFIIIIIIFIIIIIKNLQ